MNPRVKKVKAEPGYSLRLTFQNGKTRVFDMKPYLSIGVFQKLKEPMAFKSAKAVLGSVQWKGGQDLCPDTLYEESVPAVEMHSAVMAREKQATYRAVGKRTRK